MKYLLKKTFKDGKKSLVLLTAISIHLILFLIAGSTIIFKWVDSLDEVKFDSNLRINIPKKPQQKVVKIYKNIKPIEVKYIPVEKVVQIPSIIIPDISTDDIPPVEQITIENMEFDNITQDIILSPENEFSSLNINSNMVPIFQPEPVYPVELSRREIDGDIIVQFLIGTDGLTSEIKIIKSSNTGFNRSVINAVSRWKYPKRDENITIQAPVKFRIN